MTKANLGLPSAIKDSTYQNRDKLKFPSGFAFWSKGELRKSYENLLMEKESIKSNYDRILDEALVLRRQRTEDLLEINQQKELIIELYSRINKDSEYSSLKLTGGD